DVVDGAKCYDLELGAADRPGSVDLGDWRGQIAEVEKQDSRRVTGANAPQRGVERVGNDEFVVHLHIAADPLQAINRLLLLHDGQTPRAFGLYRGERARCSLRGVSIANGNAIGRLLRSSRWIGARLDMKSSVALFNAANRAPQ